MEKSTFIYGLNPVLEALKAGRKVDAMYIHSGRHKGVEALMSEAKGRGIEVIEKPLAFFDERFPKGHQGVAAKVKERGYTPLDELLGIPEKRKEPAFFVILDEIEDPRNLGAIIRSAEAAGAHGVVIQKHRAAGLTPEAVKASAGAAEHMAVSMVPNIKHAMAEMKENDILIVGAEGGAKTSPYDIDLTVPLALIVGSESKGLRETVKSKCDYLLSLPMRGRVNSLNASVAAGVFLYEILRQRLTKK